MIKDTPKDAGKYRSGSLTGLLLRAAVFSLVFNSPHIIHMLFYGSLSSINFSEGDETIYLKLAIDLSNSRSVLAPFYFEHDTANSIPNILFHSPYGVINLGVGYFTKFFGLSVTQLGLFLDIICCLFSYLVFARLFSLLSSSAIAAELGASIMLTLPWLSANLQILEAPFPGITNVVSPSFDWFYCLPVQRGISTQLSIPVLGLALFFLIRGALSRLTRKRNFALAGIAAGTLIYIYVFSWVVASALLLLGYFGLILLGRRSRKVFDLNFEIDEFLCFFIPFILSSIPGLYLQLSSAGAWAAASVPKDILSGAWFLSLELTALTLLSFLLTLRSRDKNLVLQFFFVSIASLSIQLLNNCQILFGVNLLPYHFSIFYLFPLLSGILTVCFFDYIWRWEHFRKHVVFASILVAIVYCINRKNISSLLTDLHQNNPSFLELVNFVKSEINSKSRFAIYPHYADSAIVRAKLPWRFDANSFHALTDQYVLFQTLVAEQDSTDSAKRELAISWIFHDELRLIQFCPDEEELFDSQNLFSSAFPTLYYLRLRTCEAANKLKRHYSACGILNDFKIDYIIWDSAMDWSKPPWFNSLTTSIWKSSTDTFEIFRFNQTEARLKFCNPETKSSYRDH